MTVYILEEVTIDANIRDHFRRVEGVFASVEAAKEASEVDEWKEEDGRWRTEVEFGAFYEISEHEVEG